MKFGDPDIKHELQNSGLIFEWMQNNADRSVCLSWNAINYGIQ
jgi:hypothetical protein